MQCDAPRFALQLSGKIGWTHHIASCLQDRPNVWFVPIVTDLILARRRITFFLLDCIAILPAEPFLLPDLSCRLGWLAIFPFHIDPCDRTNSPAIRPSFLSLSLRRNRSLPTLRSITHPVRATENYMARVC
jgi:hypothetical protein